MSDAAWKCGGVGELKVNENGLAGLELEVDRELSGNSILRRR